MTEALFCANHPAVATQLRCNRCGKAICSRCAVRTPVGYRCRQCVHDQQRVFDTAGTIDYPIAFVVSGGIAFFAVWLLSFIGFWGILIAPAVGAGAAEIVQRAVRRRRSRWLAMVAAAGGIAGSLPFVVGGLIRLILTFGGLQGGLWAAFDLLWPLVYGFLLVSTLYWRMRGIRL